MCRPSDWRRKSEAGKCETKAKNPVWRQHIIEQQSIQFSLKHLLTTSSPIDSKINETVFNVVQNLDNMLFSSADDLVYYKY